MGGSDASASPQTQTEPRPIRAVPKAQPTPVPETFEVTPAMRESAAKLGMDERRLDFETEKFLDHFRSKGERKVDWLAAWRNWMRRASEFVPAGLAGGSPSAARASPNGRVTIAEANRQAFAEVRERMRTNGTPDAGDVIDTTGKVRP